MTRINNIRFIFVIRLMVLLLFVCGCSQSNEPECNQYDQVIVTFKVGIGEQELLTRGSTDFNLKEAILQWSVYEVETDADGEVTNRIHLDDVSDETFFSTGNSAGTVSMTLAKGRKYQVAFFAKNKNNQIVTFEKGKMHINYEQDNSISNNLNAFTGLSPVMSSGGDSEIPVTLTRQLSVVLWFCRHLSYKIFSNDSQALKIKYDLDISGPVFKCYDVLTQTCSEQISNISYKNRYVFNGNSIGTNEYNTFLNERFYIICYNYVLTDAVSKTGTVNMELLFHHDEITDYNIKVASNSITVQQNYYTNVYGNFLTNGEIFGVTMQRDFDGDSPLKGSPLSPLTP